MDRKLPVSVEVGGREYCGEYELNKGMITVHFDLRKKTTQLGGSDHETLARVLLSELVRESNNV